MKALPRRKGNGEDVLTLQAGRGASMKALPKRKGNFPPEFLQELQGSSGRLNESPYEGGGKKPAASA